MEKITIIIPVENFDENLKPFAEKAFKSVEELHKGENTKIIFCGEKEKVNNVYEYYKNLNYTPSLSAQVVETKSSNIYEIINEGVLHCTSPYFSILQLDGRYVEKWFENVEKFKKENTTIYLPITEIVNTEGKMCGFINDIGWAEIFHMVKELGYLDTDILENYMDFNAYGAVIKTEDFLSIGSLKPSLKIAAWYEFLLRACHNNLGVYVVPKSGYYLTIGREETKDISNEEGQWLIKTAQQEYFFKEERPIKFESEK